MLRMVCELLKLTGTQVSNLFQCQVKYAFLHAKLSSIDVHHVSNNKIKPEDQWSCKRSLDIWAKYKHKTYKTWKI